MAAAIWTGDIGETPLRAQAPDVHGPDGRVSSSLIGRSEFLRELDAFLPKVAGSDCNVLINGETGTGKELVAQAIHVASDRRERPLVAVNCAAMPDSLVESELFGFERGAFTNATHSQPGKFEIAADGTIFLDEIGEMNLTAQAKLLRAVACREVQRLGARSPSAFRARLIAATNQDLDRLIADGRFRADLFYRLNVVSIHMTPLRDRPEDIPDLIEHFLNAAPARARGLVEGFAGDTLALLLRYPWPGNVRELRNLVEAVLVAAPDGLVQPDNLPKHFKKQMERHAAGGPGSERLRLIEALRAANWNKSEAARTMHWSRMTLYRKMAKYRLEHA
jgi:transcriptional regulator with PAS, ATPase and Fis domain